ARAESDASERAEILETIGFDHLLVGGHHRRKRWTAIIDKADEPKSPPLFALDGRDACLAPIERRITRRSRHTGQTAVEFVSPGAIRAEELPGATRGRVDKPRTAVTAYGSKRAHDVVGAAAEDDDFTDIVNAAPIAGVRDVALVPDDLP